MVCTSFGYRSTSARPKISKSEQSLNRYLSPWSREVKQQQLSQPETHKRVPVPQYVLGKAGQIAMNIWQKVATAEGTRGLNRTEMEMNVFFAYTQMDSNWKGLIHTPDAFVSMDEKINVLTRILDSLGCSNSFLDLMIPVLRDGSISRLQQINTDYKEINRSHRREIDVTLVTGKPLDQTSLEFYKSSIALDFLDPADNMIFSYSVDPKIVGYKVMVKNKTHDFTHNDDIRAIRQKEEAAEYYNPKEQWFKDLEGVLTTADIERIWNNSQQPQNQ